MSTSYQAAKEEIRKDLETAHTKFHQLFEYLSGQNFQKPSHNSGWTNGEILAHMTFGFVVINVLLPMARLWGRLPKRSSKWFAWLLNTFTGLFNWFNLLGARGQAKVFTYHRLGKIYDWVYFSLLKKIDSIKDDEWERGMYYPTKWDPNFDEFMTLEKLFRYPITHFNFHLEQIAR